MWKILKEYKQKCSYWVYGRGNLRIINNSIFFVFTVCPAIKMQQVWPI